MEIACGQYGDVIPKLVVAAQNDGCIKFQNARTSEMKPNNCDKSVVHYAIMDTKNLLQDSFNIDSMSTGCNELLNVGKLEYDIGSSEVNDQLSSPWKTVNIFSSDTTISSSKPVSLFTDFSSISEL